MTTPQILLIFAIASILFVGIDAWTNVKIIKEQKAKRKQGAAAMMVICWALITWFAFYPSHIDPVQTKTFILPAIVFLIPFVIRYALFDLILNKLMGWKWNFTGSTSLLDNLLHIKIKLFKWNIDFKLFYWLRFALVLILALALALSLKSQYVYINESNIIISGQKVMFTGKHNIIIADSIPAQYTGQKIYIDYNYSWVKKYFSRAQRNVLMENNGLYLTTDNETVRYQCFLNMYILTESALQRFERDLPAYYKRL